MAVYYNSTGCTANSAVTAVVYAGPAATITTAGSTYFCSGGLALHATTGTGYTWQWYNGSTIISGATSSIYTATATATYKVKVTDGTGCASMSAPVTATDLSLPNIIAAGPTTFCQGNSVSLSISTAGGTGSTPVIYQWKRNYVNISGATTGSYTATLGGSYTCYENIGGTCIATTPAVGLTMVNCNLSVTENKPADDWVIYPNPATDEVTIDNPAANGVKAGYEVVDMAGRTILSGELVASQQKINLQILPQGTYMLQLRRNDGAGKNLMFVKK